MLEERHPQLFPTNVRPETLEQDAGLQPPRRRRRAAEGAVSALYLARVARPTRRTTRSTRAGFPRPQTKMAGKPKQAIIVMPQWNADAFSHNALCAIFNRFGVSALRLCKPYHDIRRPAELERSDYAISANIGRTIASCRQAVVDIRSCIDWLAAAGLRAVRHARHQPRLLLRLYRRRAWSAACASAPSTTHPCPSATWSGRAKAPATSARPSRAFRSDPARLARPLGGDQPLVYMDQFAANPQKVLLVHATYDLTFLREYSLHVMENFRRRGIDFVSKVLPCGHYTTGETPYKYHGRLVPRLLRLFCLQTTGHCARRPRRRERAASPLPQGPPPLTTAQSTFLRLPCLSRRLFSRHSSPQKW